MRVRIQSGRTENNEVSFLSLFLDLNTNTERILTVEAGTQQTIRKRLLSTKVTDRLKNPTDKETKEE